jgi:hypothetical protein
MINVQSKILCSYCSLQEVVFDLRVYMAGLHYAHFKVIVITVLLLIEGCSFVVLCVQHDGIIIAHSIKLVFSTFTTRMLIMLDIS